MPGSIEKTASPPGQHADVGIGTSAAMLALKHADRRDGDEALRALEGAASEGGETAGGALTAAEERRLVRKIDAHLMPLLCVVYGLNYLDKTTVSYASVMGLRADLGLRGQQYSWLGSMFYFGYLAMEYPTSRLLQRLPLGKWSAANVVAWGLVLCCMAAPSSFGGAMAVRFLLGVFEAAVTPGFALFTAQWYTAREQGARTGWWFSFNGVGQMVGGAVAYAVAVGARGLALRAWQLLFLVVGLLTACVGGVFLWRMPDSQLNARFLTPRERVAAVERIRGNQQGVGNKHFKRYQFVEALADPMVWAFVLYSLVANIPNGGISNFFSQLIVSFGFTNEQSLLLGIPGGAVEVVALVASGIVGDRLRNRLLVSTAGMLLAIVGMLLIACLDNTGHGAVGRLVGYYLTQASPTPFVAILSLISTNVAGWTKKTTVAALYLIAYCVGNIIGPQVFRSADAPQYRPAEITIVVCWVVSLADVLFIYLWCRRQNRLKAERRAQPGYVRLEGLEFFDLTDRENPEFVYNL